MKTRRIHKTESGSTLVTVMVLALVLMITIEGLLSFLGSEYRMVHRTYYHGSSIYLAEAGAEEGMGMLNYGNGNWAANGWTSIGSGASLYYTKTVTDLTATDGSSVGTFAVNILNPGGSNPTIVSTGIVNGASATVQGASNSNLVRAVRVITGKASRFNYAIQAKADVNLGSNIRVDSFDSTLPGYSNYDAIKGWGTYTSAAGKVRDNGDIATNDTTPPSVPLDSNGKVLGHVNTGPGGSVTVGSGAFVSSLTNQVGGTIQPDRVSHTMNADLPAPTLPSNFSSAANLGNITASKTIVGGMSTPVDYTVSSVKMSNNQTLTFASGYTRLYITGNVLIDSNSSIALGTGAKVEIYVVGSVKLDSADKVNYGGRAVDFQLFELGSSDITLVSNGKFTGVIYAPNSNFIIDSAMDITGAVVGNTFKIDSNTQVHYDESLRNAGGSGAYAVLSWEEL